MDSDSSVTFTFVDPLNDFSNIHKHSANFKIDTVNRGNFNEDGGRLVRTNVENAHVIYHIQRIEKFYIDVWDVDTTGGDVYVSMSNDGATFELIPLSHTEPKKFGYRFLKRFEPTIDLPDNINFIKIEVRGGITGSAWKTQIGSVSIDYHRESRNPKVFYVDNQNGSDSFSGESAEEAWKSLSRINQMLLFPGDTIMLKSGGYFNGVLKPQGSGKPNLPIVITKYGGSDLPVVDGRNNNACVHLLNAENWIISDLELTNNAGENSLDGALIYRAGVLVEANSGGVKSNIQLKNLNIHHIYPVGTTTNEVGPGVYKGYGIHFVADGRTEATYFENVAIDSCNISFTSYYGLWVQHLGNDPEKPESNYNNHITVRNCVFNKTGSAGMVFSYANNVLVEKNEVSYPGATEEPKQYGRGSGVWTWRSKNVVIQHNKFMHARGFTDSCGAHIDFGNRNVVIQYNLSYDNAGGFVEILGDCVNSVYRYNISINDGFRQAGKNGALHDGKIIWIASYNGKNASPVGSVYSKIYNNTIYVGLGIKSNVIFEKLTSDNIIKNNIFYIDGDLSYENFGGNNIFDHNLYYGNVPKLPYGKHAIFANPNFKNPGSVEASDYMLSQNSIAINTGSLIDTAAKHDFWGDTLHLSLPYDRGADETKRINDFTQIEAIAIVDGGSIYPSGVVNVPLNSDFPFQLVPKPGFHIKEVFVDGVSIGRKESYTFKNVNQSHSISAEFEMLPDTVFDPLNDFSWVSDYSTNMNLKADNPGNFAGDSSRAGRNDTLHGFIEYFFLNIIDFQIVYWSWVWEGSGEISVYRSGDGVNYQPVSIHSKDETKIGNRLFSTIIPQDAMDENIHYLKIVIIGGDAAWKDQIGWVNVSYRGNSTATSTPEISNQDICIFPVPAENTLKIKGLKKFQEITVQDMQGKVIKKDIVHENLDISDLAPGIYFIMFKDFNHTLKFVKSIQ